MDNSLSPFSYLYFTPSTNPDLTIQKLPTEKFYDIFSYLDVVDIRIRTTTVCKLWSCFSKEYLEKADQKECDRIRESAKFLSIKIHECVSQYVLDSDEEDQWISKQNDLLALADTANSTNNKIPCSSLELRNQLINQLTDLEDRDVVHLRDLTQGHYANNLMWIAQYVLDVNRCKKIKSDEMVTDDDGKMWDGDEYKIEKICETCCGLTACAAFDKVLTFASEIQAENNLFTDWAQRTQAAVFLMIAKVLTQHGYISQALAIADKNIFPDDDRNLTYKVSVLKSICEGLSNMNFVDRIWEIASQIVKESCLANPDFSNLQPKKYARSIYSLGNSSYLPLLKPGSKGMLYSKKWLEQVGQEYGSNAVQVIGGMKVSLSHRAVAGELIMGQLMWTPNGMIAIERLEKTPDNLIFGYTLTLSALVYHELVHRKFPSLQAALEFATWQLANNSLFLSASTSLDRNHFKRMWLECIETVTLWLSEYVEPVKTEEKS